MAKIIHKNPTARNTSVGDIYNGNNLEEFAFDADQRIYDSGKEIVWITVAG